MAKEKSKIDHRRQGILKKCKNVVIKVGSSILVSEDHISAKALNGLTQNIVRLQSRGIKVTLVTSGAIASGMKVLNLSKRPKKMSELQACAAIGQPLLMQAYQKALTRYKALSAQILLTKNELTDKEMFTNARHTFQELLRRKVIPIINENDSVITDEIRFGDNDNLAALVTHVVGADLLILLTDQDGFYTEDPRKNPKAKKISIVDKIDSSTFAKAGGTEKSISVGGMRTKIEAAKKAAHFGASTLIASGHDPQIIKKIFEYPSLEVGTLFLPK